MIILFYAIYLTCYIFLKEKLSEELRDAMKKSRKESELNTVDSQIKGLDMRLKYGKTDKENTVRIILNSTNLCELRSKVCFFFYL